MAICYFFKLNCYSSNLLLIFPPIMYYIVYPFHQPIFIAASLNQFEFNETKDQIILSSQ